MTDTLLGLAALLMLSYGGLLVFNGFGAASRARFGFGPPMRRIMGGVFALTGAPVLGIAVVALVRAAL